MRLERTENWVWLLVLGFPLSSETWRRPSMASLRSTV